MCQKSNDYRRVDASRRFAWKIMTPKSPGQFESYWMPFGSYVKGRGYEAKEGPEVHRANMTEQRFVLCDEFHDGGFHVFTRPSDVRYNCRPRSRAQAQFFNRAVVLVEVDGYIASGYDGNDRRTAVYRWMRIVKEVRQGEHMLGKPA